MKKGYLYILTNYTHSVLYTGVTNSIKRRIQEHTEGRGSLFAIKYHCNQLVYFEVFDDIEQAINREKQLKKYHRLWKEDLINSINPEWKDLSASILDNPEMI